MFSCVKNHIEKKYDQKFGYGTIVRFVYQEINDVKYNPAILNCIPIPLVLLIILQSFTTYYLKLSYLEHSTILNKVLLPMALINSFYPLSDNRKLH